VRSVTDALCRPMPSGRDPLPVGVGLGVGNGVQAAEVASYADGVIVGSAFVRTLLDAPDEAAGARAAAVLAADLAAGCRAGN
jgi:tryptophan synthase alpha chain